MNKSNFRGLSRLFIFASVLILCFPFLEPLGALAAELKQFKGTVPQNDDLMIVSINSLPEGVTRAPEEKMESLDRVVFG